MVKELDLLFGVDAELAFQHVQAWRDEVRSRYQQAFHMLVETEKGMFGHNSFFLRQERGLSVLPSFCEQTGMVGGEEAERSEGNDGEMDLTEDVV